MTNEVKPELKACPFCGGEGQPALVHGGGLEWAQVECVDPNCGAVGPTPATQDEAIAAWNTRASPTPSGDLVERVKQAIYEAHRFACGLDRLFTDAEAGYLARKAISAIPKDDAVREALRAAEDALREHACHAGPDVPCLRSSSECAMECGKRAGDALIKVRAALSTGAKE